MQPFLVGDIGGSNCRLALYDATGRPLTPVARYDTKPTEFYAAVRSFRQSPDVARYLAEGGAWPTHACFGVAGRVDRGAVTFTNLNWTLREDDAARELGFTTVTLVNDLLAQLRAVMPQVEAAATDPARPEPTGWTRIAGIAPPPGPPGPVAAMGLGTGLGIAFAFPDPAGRYILAPSEGGHTAFSPATPEQDKLLAYLRDYHKIRHVSNERVLSGPGLGDLYRYLAREHPADVRHATRDAVERAERKDVGKVVTTAAAAGDPLAARCLDLFVEMYGQAAADIAVETLCTGGIYLFGSLSNDPQVLPRLQGPRFHEGYANKGRFAPFVTAIPCYVVPDTAAGLAGASLVAADRLRATRSA